jgi:hypothetical protein
MKLELARGDRTLRGEGRGYWTGPGMVKAMAAALLWLLPGHAPAQEAHPPGRLHAEAPLPEACRADAVSELSILHQWRGSVVRDRVACLQLRLQEGEFIRAAVEMDAAGIRNMAAFGLEIYAPGWSTPVRKGILFYWNPTRNLSWEAVAGGSYYVLLRYAFSEAPEIPARVSIESVESPDQVKARRAALPRDARVDWLRENAHPIRSISPDDTDSSDLEFLRDALRDVRIVLLGEADHDAGTHFTARSRLVKFLHQELDFDVLAFEAPLHGMAAAWDSIRTGAPVRDALRTGLWGFWSHAEQMQSLVAYIGEQAGGDRPLEVAGFDNRPWIDLPWTLESSCGDRAHRVRWVIREVRNTPFSRSLRGSGHSSTIRPRRSRLRSSGPSMRPWRNSRPRRRRRPASGPRPCEG